MGPSNKLSCETGSFSHSHTPTGFYSQRFEALFAQCQNPGLCGLTPHLFLQAYPHVNWEHRVHRPATASPDRSTSHRLATSALPHLPVSAAPASLNDGFFFNSLVVGLPYSLFLEVPVVFVFKLVAVLLLVVQGSDALLPTPPPWPEAVTRLFGRVSVWSAPCWARCRQHQRSLFARTPSAQEKRPTSSREAHTPRCLPQCVDWVRAAGRSGAGCRALRCALSPPVGGPLLPWVLRLLCQLSPAMPEAQCGL